MMGQMLYKDFEAEMGLKFPYSLAKATFLLLSLW